jgi:hypothetical protein
MWGGITDWGSISDALEIEINTAYRILLIFLDHIDPGFPNQKEGNG